MSDNQDEEQKPEKPDDAPDGYRMVSLSDADVGDESEDDSE